MKKHCIYQIEPPQPDHPQSSPYYVEKILIKSSLMNIFIDLNYLIACQRWFQMELADT